MFFCPSSKAAACVMWPCHVNSSRFASQIECKIVTENVMMIVNRNKKQPFPHGLNTLIELTRERNSFTCLETKKKFCENNVSWVGECSKNWNASRFLSLLIETLFEFRVTSSTILLFTLLTFHGDVRLLSGYWNKRRIRKWPHEYHSHCN